MAASKDCIASSFLRCSNCSSADFAVHDRHAALDLGIPRIGCGQTAGDVQSVAIGRFGIGGPFEGEVGVAEFGESGRQIELRGGAGGVLGGDLPGDDHRRLKSFERLGRPAGLQADVAESIQPHRNIALQLHVLRLFARPAACDDFQRFLVGLAGVVGTADFHVHAAQLVIADRQAAERFRRSSGFASNIAVWASSMAFS